MAPPVARTTRVAAPAAVARNAVRPRTRVTIASGAAPPGLVVSAAASAIFPGLLIEAQFTPGAWTDITPYVRQVTVTRPGSRLQGPVWQYQAGTASLTLQNNDGRFDPDNSAGPYWGSSGATRVATFSATDTWTCPAGVTSIDSVECWGGGAGGAADSTAVDGGGGGGGGEYAKETSVVVTAGSTYAVTVGAAGAGGAKSTSGNAGTAGGTTSFPGNAVTVTAHGGTGGGVNSGGSPGAGGAGGTGSANTIHRNGGAGASGVTYGGGGGGSAGPGAAGNAGSTSTGGAAVTGGGPGGNGASGAAINGSSPGSGPGGGGGGAYSSGSNRGHGGAGQSGQVVITYTSTTAGTQVLPMVPVRVSAAWSNVTYHLFTGYADAWSDAGENFAGNYDEVTLTCTDAFKVFAGITLAALGSPVGAGEDSGARVNRILDAASWSPTARAVTTGDSTLQATSYGSDVMSLLQLTADSELGGLYVDGSGTATYRHRQSLLQDTRSNTVQAVFGDLPGTSHSAGTELKYAQVSRGQDDTTLVNDCQITVVGGTLQEATDNDSIARFLYPRTYARSDLILQTDTDGLAYAQWIVYVGGGAEDRFDTLTVIPGRDPAALYPQALGRELGDRIQIWRRPPNVAAISKDVFIQGITHNITPQFWQTQWTLTSAAKYGSFFTLDNSTLGKLDSGNAIGY